MIDKIVEADSRNGSKAWWEACYRISGTEVQALQYDLAVGRFTRRTRGKVGRERGVQVRSIDTGSIKGEATDPICEHTGAGYTDAAGVREVPSSAIQEQGCTCIDIDNSVVVVIQCILFVSKCRRS